MKSCNCPESNYVLINSQELDALLEDAHASGQSSTRQGTLKLPSLEQLWNAVLNIFAKSSEPKIYQKRNSDGKLYFKVYDPIAQESSTFATEQEVRVWLDQRYYR